MGLLSIALSSGSGVARSYSEALSWMRRGAEAGDPTSMNNMGAAYEDGTFGLEKNDT